MAYYKKYTNKKKKMNRTELERLAYNMGKVERGLNNPNSRVYESYKKGRLSETNKRKPLI